VRIVVSEGKTGTSRRGRPRRLDGDRKCVYKGIEGFIIIAFYVVNLGYKADRLDRDTRAILILDVQSLHRVVLLVLPIRVRIQSTLDSLKNCTPPFHNLSLVSS